MTIVKLKSSDGEIFEVDRKVAIFSGTVKELLELGMDEGSDDKIPLPKVNASALRRVIEWIDHYKDEPILPEDDTKPNEYIPPWDTDFLKKLAQNDLFELLLAANYLNVKGLYNIICRAVANMIRGKTTEEISETFNVCKAFPPAEGEPSKS